MTPNISTTLIEATKQYQAIEARYFNGDGLPKKGALLAPNGQPTLLNKVQWLQVRTPNFKAWFGDWTNDKLALIDTNGEPIILFHGTGTDFERFDEARIGRAFNDDKEGFFLTNNTSHRDIVYHDQRTEVFHDSSSAGAYAQNAAKLSGGAATIIPAYVALKNPLIIDSRNEGDRGFDGHDVIVWLEWVLGKERTINEAKAQGNDGIVIIDRSVEFERDGAPEFLVIALDARQIKSAISNDGVFDGQSSHLQSSCAEPLAAPDDQDDDTRMR